MGGLPAEKTPLNARTTGGFSRAGYRVEHVVFESLPGFRVTANLYVPLEGTGPVPGGARHGRATRDIGKANPTYQTVWISLARRGYVVLAYDPPGQGERFEYLDQATGKSRLGAGVPEHIQAGMQCLLTGTTIARLLRLGRNPGVRLPADAEGGGSEANRGRRQFGRRHAGGVAGGRRAATGGGGLVLLHDRLGATHREARTAGHGADNSRLPLGRPRLPGLHPRVRPQAVSDQLPRSGTSSPSRALAALSRSRAARACPSK